MTNDIENTYPLLIDKIVKDFCRKNGKYDKIGSEELIVFLMLFMTVKVAGKKVSLKCNQGDLCENSECCNS